MSKIFNVSADCKPSLHYMVDITGRLAQVKEMVDRGDYFTINRARQYGKTTLLRGLERYLGDEYQVISLDFQMMSHANFENEKAFVSAFSCELLDNTEGLPRQVADRLEYFAGEGAENSSLLTLFKTLNQFCEQTPKKVVLIIDEVDSATNNQVFLDFLAQLRGSYIRRDVKPTFQSVILAGIYDIRNLKRKLRPNEEQKVNSPWNIAADFCVDLHFTTEDIAGMLETYEADYQTGMNVPDMACLLSDYTSGYPFLVSRLCKLMDERVAGSNTFPDKACAWTRNGFLVAVKMLLEEKNTLFESLTGKLYEYPELKKMIYLLLFQGQNIAYNPDHPAIDVALMFGFVKVEQGNVLVANRIFEIRLYNMFLTLPQMQNNRLYLTASQEKNQFTQNGRLDMQLVLEKFVTHFRDIYGNRGETFYEEDGRRYFLLYLKPIINGVGNYYIEARTRDAGRTDVIVDYLGEQFVIEMKIWRGNAYHTRGEQQLSDYLDSYHLDTGYLLSFRFDACKEPGVHKRTINGKTLIEAMV